VLPSGEHLQWGLRQVLAGFSAPLYRGWPKKLLKALLD
jgi:hypothetical protein